VKYVENPALITPFPFRSKLGRWRIFQVFLVQILTLINFGRNLVTFNSSFKYSLARPEQGDAYRFKIVPTHGQLEAAVVWQRGAWRVQARRNLLKGGKFLN